MVKCPKTAWLKPLRKNSNEQSKRTHAKNTTSTLTSIYFLLLFVFGFSLCFWLLFLVLIFATPNVAMATRVTHQDLLGAVRQEQPVGFSKNILMPKVVFHGARQASREFHAKLILHVCVHMYIHVMYVCISIYICM